MQTNERILLFGEAGLLLLGALGLAYGHAQIAYAAVGAFAGLLAGHINGRQGNASSKAGEG